MKQILMQKVVRILQCTRSAMQIVSDKSFNVKPPSKQVFYKEYTLTEIIKILYPRGFTNNSF